MNFKMLLPSYRTRYHQTLEILRRLKEAGYFAYDAVFLNLGCGEGDFDKDILRYFSVGHGCDINEEDVCYCQEMATESPMHYAVADGQNLPYGDDVFDCVVCIDVIEHVPRPALVIQESSRVLKPGGYAIFSFPRQLFPVLYDPLNAVLNLAGRKFSFGAYGYGHDKLISDQDFRIWADVAGFLMISEHKLSGELVGAVECYWPGCVQKLIKHNAGNQGKSGTARLAVRPTGHALRMVRLTDAIINLDRVIAGWLPTSIGKMCLLHKPKRAGRDNCSGVQSIPVADKRHTTG